MKNDLLTKFRDIQIFLFDLEGVLIKENFPKEKSIEVIRKECREFNHLVLLFGIVTASDDKELLNNLRAIEGCYVLSSSLDKVSATDIFLTSHSTDYKNVFYIGDDILDIPLLKKCGLSCAPKNARREVKRIVSFVAKSETPQDLLNEIIGYIKKSKEMISRATKY